MMATLLANMGVPVNMAPKVVGTKKAVVKFVEGSGKRTTIGLGWGAFGNRKS